MRTKSTRRERRYRRREATNGGMMVGLDRLVARPNGGFVSRQYAVDGMTLYVNNGTGIWPGFALRLGRPSELTRFTLRRGLAAD